MDGVSNVIIEEEFSYACSGIGVALEGNGLAVRKFFLKSHIPFYMCVLCIFIGFPWNILVCPCQHRCKWGTKKGILWTFDCWTFSGSKENMISLIPSYCCKSINIFNWNHVYWTIHSFIFRYFIWKLLTDILCLRHIVWQNQVQDLMWVV